MIKRLMIPAILALMLVGCAALEEQANDPNSALSGAVTTIDAVARSVQESAPVAGPYGWIAGALATAVAGATGVYKVRQKNRVIATDGQVIKAQQREFNIVRDTTKAIVDAVERMGNVEIPQTIAPSKDGKLGSVIKAYVGEELEKKKISNVGKAVISGIKAARNEDAQKMQ